MVLGGGLHGTSGTHEDVVVCGVHYAALALCSRMPAANSASISLCEGKPWPSGVAATGALRN